MRAPEPIAFSVFRRRQGRRTIRPVGRVASPTFIARDEQLARLLAAFERARGGTAGVVVIAGEAGVGKSRLLAEFASRVRAAGGQAFTGGSIEFHEALPYAPVIEALRPVVATADEGLLERVVGGSGGDLGRLFPQLERDSEPQPAGTEPRGQSRLFEQLLDLVGRLAREAATLLALEDLHWADASTQDFFSFLVRNLTAERIVLVATYRDDEVDRRHPLHLRLAQLERDRRIERIELSRFGRDDFERQLAGIRGRAVPGALADRIFERSGGNPFFTEELLASEAATDTGDVPTSVREALLTRVDRLSGDAQRLLTVAAVAGRDAEADLLVAVSGLAREPVERALREAVGAHVLVATDDDRGRYAFRHALMQEALYGELLPTERSRLHALVAEALSTDASLAGDRATRPAGEIAFHWLRAQRWPEALATALEAADVAAAGYAFPEELTHLEQVLELWERVPRARGGRATDRAALAERAAIAAERVGNSRRATSLLELALTDVDAGAEPLRAGRLYARLADTRLYLDDIERGEAALEEAARLVPTDAPSRELIELLAIAGRWRHASARAAATSVDAAAVLSVAGSIGDPRLEAQARIAAAVSGGYVGDSSEAFEHLLAAQRIGEELADPELITNSMHMLGHAFDGAGRFGEAADMFLSGAARSRELGMARSIGQAMENDAAEAFRQMGDWPKADALVARVLGEIERYGSYGPAMRHAIPAHLYVSMGRFDDAERQLQAAWDGARRTGAGGLAGHIFAARAELAIWRARWDEAREAVAEGLTKIGSTEDLRWIGTLAAFGLRAEAERAALDRVRGRQEEVDEAIRAGTGLIETARATAGKARQVAWREGEGHHALAEAEWHALSGADDPALWHEAAETWSRLGQPYPEAYARFRQARALRRSGAARKEVAAAASEGLAIASRLGAAPLIEAIETFARGARVRLPGARAGEPAGGEPVYDPAGAEPVPPGAARYGLTPREEEVLALLAAGRTNRQIAEALYISESTAGVHVSKIIAKLGASNRVEAAALAVRLELTAP